MSFELTTERKQRATRPSWASSAFIVETMLLLVFLIASLAVFMQLFSAALAKSDESGKLTTAVAVASATAEHFSVDPTHTPSTSTVDDMVVTCDIKPTRHENGTLYRAVITVTTTDGEELYTLNTATYESGVS